MVCPQLLSGVVSSRLYVLDNDCYRGCGLSCGSVARSFELRPRISGITLKPVQRNAVRGRTLSLISRASTRYAFCQSYWLQSLFIHDSSLQSTCLHTRVSLNLFLLDLLQRSVVLFNAPYNWRQCYCREEELAGNVRLRSEAEAPYRYSTYSL